MRTTSHPEPAPTEAEFSRQMDVIFDGMRGGQAQEHEPIEESSSPAGKAR